MANSKSRSQRVASFKAVLNTVEKKYSRVPAVLGDGAGTVVSTRGDNYVYARTTNSHSLIVCLNKRVPFVNNLKVWVGFSKEMPNKLQVLSLREDDNSDSQFSETAKHHETHEYGMMGTDVVNVFSEQLVPWRVDPIGGMEVQVYRSVGQISGTLQYMDSQTLDLTGYRPATGSVYALIGFVGNNTLQVRTGPIRAARTQLTFADVPSFGNNLFPLAAIVLTDTQTEVTRSLMQTDILDLRFIGYAANSDKLDGYDASYFLTLTNISGTHNQLNGLQGGIAPNEYYHLSATDYSNITGSSFRTRLNVARTFYVRTTPAVVTVSIASPCVVSWTNHGLAVNDAVIFQTNGALPTGLTAGTVYYVISAGYGTNSFEISTSIGGSAVNTSGAQSGQHKAQTGNDNNDGASATYGHALLTIQEFVNIAAAFDNGGNDITGQLSDGVYKEAITLKSGVGAGRIVIQGNSATPTNVKLLAPASSDLFTATNVITIYQIKDVNFTSVDAGFATIVAVGASSYIEFGNVDFGNVSGVHMRLNSGQVTAISNYTISGGAVRHVNCSNEGVLVTVGLTILVTGTPAFSSAFAAVDRNSLFSCSGNTYSGSATGTRYTLASNGVIYTAGAGATYLPGNAAGTNDGTGVYV